MSVSIERCVDLRLWRRVGEEANSDRPEYAADNVVWPVYDEPQNGRADLSVVASVDGRPVGRLQRRGETLLELAVAPQHRRRGVGSALLDFALRDAQGRGMRQVRVPLYIDEEDAPAVAFFDRLGFARTRVFSMLADLDEPVPPQTQARARDLHERGFRPRVLDPNNEDDAALAVAVQARYFPGSPGYVSEAEMVRLCLDRGVIAMVLEKDHQWAGFMMGLVHGATKNGRYIRRGDCGLLASIATAEAFRRMGIASAIVCAFIDLLRQETSPRVRYLLYGGCGPPGDPSRGVAESVGARHEVRHWAFSRALAPGDSP